MRRRWLLPALALLIVALVGVRMIALTGGEEEEEGKIPNEWFFTQRAFPLGDIPMDRYLAAVDQAEFQRGLAGGGAAVGTGSWTPIGPTNIGGRITAVDVHLDMPNRIFFGAAFGGVFRSTDNGSSWTVLTDDQPSLSIGDLVIDPNDPDRILVGTGEANTSGDSYPGTGVYESTDAGETWSFKGLFNSRHIGRLSIHPLNSDRIFAAVAGGLYSTGPDRGVYRSTDGGDSWEKVLFVSDSTGCIDLVQHPTDPNIVFAAMWERLRGPGFRYAGGVTSGIYRSTDGGDNWTLLGSGLPGPAPDIGRIGLAISESNPEILYAIYADDPGYFLGLYKTTNGGDTWSQTNDGSLSGLFSSFGWYFGNVRVDPQDPDRVYAMGLDTYRSTNGGNSWGSITGSIHVDEHDWWISPEDSDLMISANDGGLYRTTNGASSWTKFVDLPIAQFYAATVDPQQPWRAYGGTQDNGTLRSTGGQEDDWERIFGGDGFYCIVDPFDSDVIYVEYQYGNLYKTVNDGGGWNYALDGVNSSDRRNWSTPVFMDPNFNQRLYYGTYRVYRTINGADSWTAISPDLTNGPGSGNLIFGTVTTIAVAATNPDVIWAGTDDGNVWVTTDAGGNWTKVSDDLPERWITRVAVDPLDDAVAYVTLSGYRIDEELPRIFRTTDYGQTWENISGNLPDSPINVVVVDPDHTNYLFVGTDVGVYYTYNLGEDWVTLGNGFPIVSVHDLVLHNPTRTLVAATHGRSMFTHNISVASVPEGGALSAGVLSLQRPAPNPFSQQAVIRYRLSAAADVSAAVYDVLGRKVFSWAREARGAGEHELSWDGRTGAGTRAGAGVYWLRVKAGVEVQAARMLLQD